MCPFVRFCLPRFADYGSSFKYILPDGTLAEVKDYHGSVRLFTNTYTVGEGEEREEAYLWHTVVSERAHRHSLGFEITPELMVALLDTCDGCWDDFRALSEQYNDPLGGARGQGGALRRGRAPRGLREITPLRGPQGRRPCLRRATE